MTATPTPPSPNDDYILPAKLGQAIIDYLSQRPYAEVYQLISQLVQMEKIHDVEDQSTVSDPGYQSDEATYSRVDVEADRRPVEDVGAGDG